MSENNILLCIIFYSCAVLIVFSAFLSIFTNRIIYSLLFAVIVFFTASGLFFLLGAEYNAVIQIAIYGIAVPILFIFAIMFTSDKLDKQIYLSFSPRFSLTMISASLFVLTIFNILIVSSSVMSWIFTPQSDIQTNKYVMFDAISSGLYINYVLAFEFVSLLLLLVIVGISSLNLFKERKRG